MLSKICSILIIVQFVIIVLLFVANIQCFFSGLKFHNYDFKKYLDYLKTYGILWYFEKCVYWEFLLICVFFAIKNFIVAMPMPTIINIIFVLCILKLIHSVYNIAADSDAMMYRSGWVISDIIAICLSFLCIFLKDSIF